MPGITALHTGQKRWQVSIHPPGTRSKSWAKSRAKAAARASRSSGWFTKLLRKQPRNTQILHDAVVAADGPHGGDALDLS
eukprot:11690097-Alexandrium_andersonii.AAC.1